MQFTKAEAYGIFGMLYLAGQPSGRVTPLSEISEAQDIPEKFLAKIFQSLSKTGLIRSYRGVKGGFSLGRPADEITIREVVEHIQGPYYIAKCLGGDNLCDRVDCPIKVLLQKTQTAMMDIFSQHTIADLLKWQKTVKVPQTV